MIIILFLFFVTMIVLLIWQYKNPKEAILLGRRSLYKNEPEVHDVAVEYVKYVSIFRILFIIMLFFIFILESLRSSAIN